MHSLKSVMWSVCALVALPLLPATAAPERPNIMIIVADDMGFSDAGCYGGEIATPNIDKLAANGLRYTQFYNTARCWPSRSCILTGYYAQQVGMDPSVGKFPAWTRLLPQILDPLGYRSYHSGKWHVLNAKNPVKDGGFDETGGALVSENHGSDTIANHAIQCLKDHSVRHSDAPFFSYICFTAPHFPLHASQEDIAKCRDRYKDGWDAVRLRRWSRLKELGIADNALPPLEKNLLPPGFKADCLKTYGPGEIPHAEDWGSLTGEQKDFQSIKMAIHAASVERMDQEIGRILDQLAAMKQLDNTLIFFLSDNGASAEIMVRGNGHDPHAPAGSPATYLCLGPGWSSCSNTPFRRHKIWVNEGGVSTPLIVHWPKGIAAHGELRHTPGHLVDIASTIFDILGVHPTGKDAPPLPGRSLLPTFSQDVVIQRDFLYFKHQGNQALRMGDWKIIGKAGKWELYNLGNDRGEIVDLADREPARLKEMVAQWEKLDAEFVAQGGERAEGESQTDSQ